MPRPLCLATATCIACLNLATLPPRLAAEATEADTPAERFAAVAAHPGAVWWTPADGDAAPNWFVDGDHGQVAVANGAVELHAGPAPGRNADHLVWWTGAEFAGDMRIDFEYTRLDRATQDVNILYLYARGSGTAPYSADIGSWRDLRREPKMGLYFNHMAAYHVSFAAFGDEAHPESDYVRARRYLPESGRHLSGTGLAPDGFDTGLFKPGLTYRCTVIRAGDDLFFDVQPERSDDAPGRLFHWDLRQQIPLHEGRIGLRLMAGRAARFAAFVVRHPAGRD